MKKLPKLISKRIATAIEELAAQFESKNIQKLKGTPFYRMRVGDYRVIYDVIQSKLLVLIVNVGHRKNIYK